MQTNSVEKSIKDFFEKAGLFVAEDFNLVTNSSMSFSLYVKDSRLLIGRDGEIIHAIVYLLKRCLEKDYGESFSHEFHLDINDFFKKQIDQLKTKAHMLAERARFFKSSVELPPMNGYERKIVHEYLDDYKNIRTESTGEGRERHIVIHYTEETP